MFSNAIRIASSRAVRFCPSASRHISVACNQSIDKLYGILEEYRASHYSQEFPKRFRKDVVKAACSKSSCPGLISAEGIESILHNIGASNQMPRSEIESMLKEICDGNGSAEDYCTISVDQMFNLLSNRGAA
ncbi:hypothetical protein ACHAWO_012172 [Cyclotella atomus]|uniref:Uncharacterized protein n=1 Tax=Cyclotella atomus TaxID=382360 RepID=A0ABD3PJS2_9STRA